MLNTASSPLLGCAFRSIGFLISALAPERAVANGATVTTWLLTKIYYEPDLLVVLMIDKRKHFGEDLFSAHALMLPADTYRQFNFTGFEEVGT